MEPIGFVGLGAMGGAIARNLARRGLDVIGWDLAPEAVKRCTETAPMDAAASWDDLVKRAATVCTSLPLPEDVERCYLADESGLVARLTPGTVCIDVSTIDPITARRVADSFSARQLHFVAAPVGKGPVQAEHGHIPVFVGGEDEAVFRATSLLQQIGDPVLHLGDVEQATAFKLISNMIGMTVAVATAEGLAFAARAGISPDILREALAGTGADSYQLHARGAAMLAGDHPPRFAVDLALKDLRLGVDVASRFGVPVPTVATTMQTLAMTSRAGFGGADVSAVYEVLKPVDRKSGPHRSASDEQENAQ